MPDITSMRGVKALEQQHFGQNRIATVMIQNGATTVMDTGANSLAGVQNLLLNNLVQNKTLLWVYSAGNAAGIETIIFGYDQVYGPGKIGHAALIGSATIAGEIRALGVNNWLISNESGAWGAKGGTAGKSAALANVARIMTNAGIGINVSAERAFSRYGAKRKIQELVRGNTRKVQ